VTHSTFIACIYYIISAQACALLFFFIALLRMQKQSTHDINKFKVR